jgi:hypothetical protein
LILSIQVEFRFTADKYSVIAVLTYTAAPNGEVAMIFNPNAMYIIFSNIIFFEGQGAVIADNSIPGRILDFSIGKSLVAVTAYKKGSAIPCGISGPVVVSGIFDFCAVESIVYAGFGQDDAGEKCGLK